MREVSAQCAYKAMNDICASHLPSHSPLIQTFHMAKTWDAPRKDGKNIGKFKLSKECVNMHSHSLFWTFFPENFPYTFGMLQSEEDIFPAALEKKGSVAAFPSPKSAIRPTTHGTFPKGPWLRPKDGRERAPMKEDEG